MAATGKPSGTAISADPAGIENTPTESQLADSAQAGLVEVDDLVGQYPSHSPGSSRTERVCQINDNDSAIDDSA